MSAVTNLYNSGSLAARVAAEVRGHAAKRGLMQMDMAKALGLSQAQMSERMRGKVPLKLDELETLATLFGIEPADLMPRRGAAADTTPPKGLPELDLNQQPFGYGNPQATATLPQAQGSRLQLIPGGRENRPNTSWYERRTDEHHPPTRGQDPRPFRPLTLCSAV